MIFRIGMSKIGLCTLVTVFGTICALVVAEYIFVPKAVFRAPEYFDFKLGQRLKTRDVFLHGVQNRPDEQKRLAAEDSSTPRRQSTCKTNTDMITRLLKVDIERETSDDIFFEQPMPGTSLSFSCGDWNSALIVYAGSMPPRDFYHIVALATLAVTPTIRGSWASIAEYEKGARICQELAAKALPDAPLSRVSIPHGQMSCWIVNDVLSYKIR